MSDSWLQPAISIYEETVVAVRLLCEGGFL